MHRCHFEARNVHTFVPCIKCAINVQHAAVGLAFFFRHLMTVNVDVSSAQMQCWLPIQGFEYLMKYQLVDDTAEELAKFLHSNRQLDPQKKREFLATRSADSFFSVQ